MTPSTISSGVARCQGEPPDDYSRKLAPSRQVHRKQEDNRSLTSRHAGMNRYRPSRTGVSSHVRFDLYDGPMIT